MLKYEAEIRTEQVATTVSFQWKNPDFLLKNVEFMINRQPRLPALRRRGLLAPRGTTGPTLCGATM